MFKKREVVVTPLLDNTFLLSSEGELKVILNPPSKPELREFNEALTEVIGHSEAPFVVPKDEREVAETWPEQLIVVPGKRPIMENKIFLPRDELYEVGPEYTFSFPSLPENAEEAPPPFIVIKASNLHMLYASSSVRVASPPKVDVLLVPRMVLEKAIEKAESTYALPLHLGCQPNVTITTKLQKEERKEEMNVPGLHKLPSGHSLRLIRHLSSVKKLGLERDLSNVLPMLEFV